MLELKLIHLPRISVRLRVSVISLLFFLFKICFAFAYVTFLPHLLVLQMQIRKQIVAKLTVKK